MKLYIKVYVCQFVCFCQIIDIPDGHFKIQDGGLVSCRYQFHINPCTVKCMCTVIKFNNNNNIDIPDNFGIIHQFVENVYHYSKICQTKY